VVSDYMKLIGYWMNDLREPDLPLPQELVGEMPAPDREAVCKYFNSAQVFESYRGYSWCRFHCGVEYKAMGFREFTDGTWAWPEGLAHYVHVHNVILPDEFIRSAKENSPKVHDGTPANLDFWVNWARRYRSEDLRKRLERALNAARAAEQELIRAMQATALSQPIGKERCIYRGCLDLAVVGRKFCPQHDPGYQLHVRARTNALYDLSQLPELI
jgi:hypothetical protein